MLIWINLKDQINISYINMLFQGGDFLKYEELLEEATKNNLYVIEKVNFESNSKGLINNDVIGLSNKLYNDTERLCILAEEIGHYKTNVGNVLNQNLTNNRKQEQFARLWAYNKLIGLRGIINAYTAGCSNKYEIAEFLNVTVEFLEEAIKKYTDKYGVCTLLDNYIIYFIPNIGVMELI